MPRPPIIRQVALTLTVLVLLLGAGCSAVPQENLSTPAQLGEHVQSRYDSLEYYSATVERSVETPAERATLRAQIAVRTGEWMQIHYLNGPQAGTTEHVSLEDRSAPQTMYSLQATPGSRMHPPALGTMATAITRTHNLTLERTTVLDGHLTAVVAIDPIAANASTNRTQHLWVDTQRGIPLKYQSTWTTADGRQVTETIHLSNVTLHEKSTTQTG